MKNEVYIVFLCFFFFLGGLSNFTVAYSKPQYGWLGSNHDFVLRNQIQASEHLIETPSIPLKLSNKDTFRINTWSGSFLVRFGTLLIVLVIIYIVMRLLYHRQNLKYSLKIEKLEKQKLEEINEAKLRFFTDLSHDLKTPLTLISGPLEKLYLSGNYSEEEVKKLLPIVYRNSKRLMVLINQLLTFRKLNAGELELKAVKADIVGFIRELIRNYEILRNEKEIELIQDYKLKTIEVWFDPLKMEQIMHNLLSNAFKFTNKKGILRITVELSAHNSIERKGANTNNRMNWVRIAVYNQGSSIPPENVNRIFDRFFQDDSSIGGTGIGLSVARSLVELHQGSISVNTDYSDGVEFEFFIPVMGDHLREDQKILTKYKPVTSLSNLILHTVQASSKELVKNLSVKHEHEILIFEDNTDLREYLEYALSPYFNVKVSDNGKDGLRMAEDQIPDIVISDILMPGLNGYDVVRHLKGDIKTCHIPVLLLTAKSTGEDQIMGYDAGADAYVIKPFNLDVLIAQVFRLIKNRELMQENYRQWIYKEKKADAFLSRDDSFLSRVNSYIEQNIQSEDFSVNELSELINLSTTQIYRKIKALTGYSPVEYIRKLKLHNACLLLSENIYSIKEISFKAGFNDPSYFGKCFKNEYGTSPKAFRFRNHKKILSFDRKE